MKKLLLIALLGSSGILHSQNVGINPEAFRRLCANEKAPANLRLPDVKVVEGAVIDQTGAKFERDVAVQLRSPRSGEIIRSAVITGGEFSLGEVQPGSYRLIVVKLGASGGERLRMFDQPRSLTCEGVGSQCRLEVMPTVHGTDNLIDFCPPK